MAARTHPPSILDPPIPEPCGKLDIDIISTMHVASLLLSSMPNKVFKKGVID